MGRPPKDINADEVRRLAAIGCTWREIGAWFGCDESTVRKKAGMSAEFELGQQSGKTSLRRMQWKRAKAGSDTMLIHLGKHLLGQTDQPEIVSTSIVEEAMKLDAEWRARESERTFGTVPE